MEQYYPIVATVMIDVANSGHIIKMFQQKSSEGQSLISIALVIGALFLWERFYSVRTPDEKFAIWSARFGIVFNTLVLAVAVYYS